MKKKKTKKPTVAKLKKKLDKVFSEWIRRRDRDICFTCGNKGTHAGHYILRRHMNTRWDERNVHCQCVRCNVFEYGNMDVYALRLQTQYGDGILNELNMLKHTIKQFTVKELEELIEKYAAP